MSVVIPAHDEAGVIGPLLAGVVGGAQPGEFEVVVVANGCSDATAERARAVDGVRVVEIAEASKTAALNAGDRAAATFPRAYVDADVVVTAQTLREVARVLADDGAPLVAAPVMQVDLTGCSFWVRRFYDAWPLTDYRRQGHVGSGFYALTRAGRARFGDFPDIIADDTYVKQFFAVEERTTVRTGTFVVRAPKTLRVYVRRAVRIAAGNSQLAGHQVARDGAGRGRRVAATVARGARRPRLWLGLLTFAYVNVVVRVRARSLVRRGAVVTWRRDETTRAPAPG